ncbi:MAG: cyclodeaminase/cyclohydrolase family protein [Synergistaceae bacterium]|nr:cyclodeaminase/cyclohydrolase family protein [Synergistaceae bacterium]
MVKINFIQESCESFAAQLASNSPVPGGGGGAAFVGALGVALCSMAGNFTLGKKKYADVENDVKKILEKCERLRKNLLALVDEDAKNFEPLSKAYRIPKDAPQRAEILENALLNACEVPLKIVKNCAEVIDLLDEMFQKGSKLLISDVGCGALFSRAAMEAAALNIFVNTALLRDREKAKALEAETNEILSRYCPKASEISEDVKNLILKS